MNVRISLFVAALAASAFVTPASAVTNPTTCVSSAATGTCRFLCAAGARISVRVSGSGAVQGSASCGDGFAHCTGTNTCTRTDTTSEMDLGGYCDLTTGVTAVCSSVI